MVRTGSLRIARSYLMAGLHGLVAIAVLPLAFVDNLPVALACMSVAVAAGLGANPMFYAVIADVAPRNAGTCMGIMNSGLAVSGFLAPVITGFALQATGTFTVPDRGSEKPTPFRRPGSAAVAARLGAWRVTNEAATRFGTVSTISYGRRNTGTRCSAEMSACVVGN